MKYSISFKLSFTICFRFFDALRASISMLVYVVNSTIKSLFCACQQCHYFATANYRTNKTKQGRLAGPLSSLPIDIERRKHRLLKFCYVPATSAAHYRLLFFSFLLQLFTVLMKQTRQEVRAVKQSIFLDVYEPT